MYSRNPYRAFGSPYALWDHERPVARRIETARPPQQRGRRIAVTVPTNGHSASNGQRARDHEPELLVTPGDPLAAPPAAETRPTTTPPVLDGDGGDRTEALERALASARAGEAQLVDEFKNYRRHAEAALASAKAKAKLELLAELGETLQALERAGDAADGNADAVREGVALLARNLQKVFDAHGLRRVATAGEAFDPRLHEAVLTEQLPGVERGTVVREIAPGFCTDDAVVRPAKVSVAA